MLFMSSFLHLYNLLKACCLFLIPVIFIIMDMDSPAIWRSRISLHGALIFIKCLLYRFNCFSSMEPSNDMISSILPFSSSEGILFLLLFSSLNQIFLHTWYRYVENLQCNRKFPSLIFWKTISIPSCKRSCASSLVPLLSSAKFSIMG